MKNTAAFAILALMILGCSQPPEGRRAPVDSTSQAVVTCKKYSQFTPGFCIDFGFTEMPAGFADCAGDDNTYDGEVTLHSFINFGEECIWAHPSVGTCMGWPQMKDWDNASGHMGAHYAVSRLHTISGLGLTLYSASNFGGTAVTAPVASPANEDVVNLPFFIQSGNACNVF